MRPLRNCLDERGGEVMSIDCLGCRNLAKSIVIKRKRIAILETQLKREREVRRALAVASGRIRDWRLKDLSDCYGRPFCAAIADSWALDAEEAADGKAE